MFSSHSVSVIGFIFVLVLPTSFVPVESLVQKVDSLQQVVVLRGTHVGTGNFLLANQRLQLVAPPTVHPQRASLHVELEGVGSVSEDVLVVILTKEGSLPAPAVLL